jgi:hypothetical protein
MAKKIHKKFHTLARSFQTRSCSTKLETKIGTSFSYGTLLSSIDASDISTIPVSVEQYVNELQKLTREQLKHVSHSQVLDDDQR